MARRDMSPVSWRLISYGWNRSENHVRKETHDLHCLPNTVRSERRCVLRLGYVHLVVSIEVAVEVCCCLTVFSC
jgi:hypothetical protein